MQGKSNKIWQSYNNFFESFLPRRRFLYEDFLAVVRRHNTKFAENIEGFSVEGRAIHSYTIGTGKTNVLLWSQMHGNEPSSTLALLDVMNFLETVSALPLLKSVTICAVPMLNPDGNEVFTRRNAMGIDLNRDARNLTAPESLILKNLHTRIKPQFAFNMHDQELYYTTAPQRKQTLISFLAPKYNVEGDTNDTRLNAIKLIATAREFIEPFAPNTIAKYNDRFTPNAFGDNMMLWGTSSTLVECGSAPNDIERTSSRRAAAMSIIKMIKAIASKEYLKADPDLYYTIPDNIRDNIFDLKISNISITMPHCKPFRADIGIRRYKGIDIEDFADYSNEYRVEGFGDLADFGGIKTYDGAQSSIEIQQAIKPGCLANFTITQNNGTQISVNQLY